MKITEAVNSQLSTLPLSLQNSAAAELGRAYAFQIDLNPMENIATIGPKLLACLDALGLTPKSARLMKKGGTDVTPESLALDELRARRARQNGSAHLDASA